MMERLSASLGTDYEDFQIILSRVRELKPDKYRVLWCHDLPEDPESQHLANNGWNKFHAIVFVSHWQRQQYVNRYNIPWSRTWVFHNAINVPQLTTTKKISNDGPIKLIYHTTPHRGLEILVPVVKKLQEKFNLELDVYSSFNVYGWGDRDKPYEPLFEEIKNAPGMRYHGAVSHDEVQNALGDAHMFVYPCIWPETSCLSLIEAMMNGLVCVHPDLAALPETCANWNHMYQWNDNPQQHAGVVHDALGGILSALGDEQSTNLLINRATMASDYMRAFYNWDVRATQWKQFLNHLRQLPLEIKPAGGMFILRT